MTFREEQTALRGSLYLAQFSMQTHSASPFSATRQCCPKNRDRMSWHRLLTNKGFDLTMGKKKPYMAVFDAFDRLAFNENTKNRRQFERYSKSPQI